MTLYSSSGQLNTTVVNGSSYTGLHAGDGSYNIVLNTSTSPVGLYHPCGAYNAVAGTATTYYHANGSVNVVSNGAGGYYLSLPSYAGTIPPVTFTTLDAGSNTNATLSLGNLKSTRTSTAVGGSRSISYKSSGLLFFEATKTQSGGTTDAIAVGDSSATYGNINSGSPGNYAAYWMGDGSIVIGGSSTGFNLGIAANGDVIGTAINFNTGKGWMRRNNGLWNGNGTADPASGVNGFSVVPTNSAPMLCWSNIGSPVVGDNVTFNFGASSFAFTSPVGYSGWSV